MISVAAPDGYEGCRQWKDAVREWEAAARPVGRTWWTLCGLVGHNHLTEETLDARAQSAIKRAVELGMVT